MAWEFIAEAVIDGFFDRTVKQLSVPSYNPRTGEREADRVVDEVTWTRKSDGKQWVFEKSYENPFWDYDHKYCIARTLTCNKFVIVAEVDPYTVHHRDTLETVVAELETICADIADELSVICGGEVTVKILIIPYDCS